MQRPLFPLLVFSLCLGSEAALAQPEADTDLYDGKWVASLQTGTGNHSAARVVIANFGGTWQDLPGTNRAVNKACGGKKMPITVQRSVSTEMQFMVWGSSVAPMCPDLSVSLKPTGAKTLEGTIGVDTKLKLTRR